MTVIFDLNADDTDELLLPTNSTAFEQLREIAAEHVAEFPEESATLTRYVLIAGSVLGGEIESATGSALYLLEEFEGMTGPLDDDTARRYENASLTLTVHFAEVGVNLAWA